MAYGLSFASITAVLTHVFLYYRQKIWIQARRSLSEQPDIHARLMSVYKEVPNWWYLTIFCLCPKFLLKRERVIIIFAVTMFVFGVIVIEVWKTELPVWGFVLALLICAFT